MAVPNIDLASTIRPKELQGTYEQPDLSDTSSMDGMVSSGDSVAPIGFNWDHTAGRISVYRWMSKGRAMDLMKDNRALHYNYRGPPPLQKFPGSPAGNLNKMGSDPVAYFTLDLQLAKQMAKEEGGVVVEFSLDLKWAELLGVQCYSYGSTPNDQLMKDVIENKNSQIRNIPGEDTVKIETRSNLITEADWVAGAIAHAPLGHFQHLNKGWEGLTENTNMRWLREISDGNGGSKFVYKGHWDEKVISYPQQVMLQRKGLELVKYSAKRIVS